MKVSLLRQALREWPLTPNGWIATTLRVPDFERATLVEVTDIGGGLRLVIQDEHGTMWRTFTVQDDELRRRALAVLDGQIGQIVAQLTSP